MWRAVFRRHLLAVPTLGEGTKRCGNSIDPTAVYFVDIHESADEVLGSGQFETFGIRVVEQFDRNFWRIGIVGVEYSRFTLMSDVEKQQGVIDFETRKSNHMHHTRSALAQACLQQPCRPLLTGSMEGENHAPMAALQVTPPGGTAFLLEQLGACAAEFPQTEVPWDLNPWGLGRIAKIASSENRTNKFSLPGLNCARQCRIELRMPPKLARSLAQDEAAQAIGGFLGTLFPRLSTSRRIHRVDPTQLVGERKSVALENEAVRDWRLWS